MDNLIANSLKKFFEINSVNNEILEYLKFYDELRDLREVRHIYEKVQNWIENRFDTKALKITIYSQSEHEKEIVYQNEKDEVYTKFDLSKNYQVDINSNLAINFCIVCNDKEHYETISSKDNYLNTLFYMIAPFIATVSYQELVKELTFKDSLTCVYNRKFLNEHLKKLLPLAKRENKNLSFLMVGIDHFKAVIDEFDYDIGDKLLVSLADILQKNIRESDLIVRLDSDEFLITLVGTTNKKDALIVAQKLIDSFADSSIIVSEQGHILKKTICVGVTHFENDLKSIDDILKNADISLYEAKNLGRGRINEYIPSDVDCVDLF